MRELLLGPAGCGKTRRVLEVIRDYLAQGQGPKLLVLLPTESLVAHFKVLILEEGNPAGFVDQFLFTFHGLSYFLASSRKKISLARPHQKILLLEEILNKNCPPYFKGVKDYPGFRQSLLNSFRELKEQKVAPASLDRQALAFETLWSGKSVDRLRALLQVYQDYQRAIEEKGWWDAEDLLHHAAELLQEDKTLLTPKELLIVDGFYSFTRPEKTLLELLLKRIPQSLITLTVANLSSDPAVAGLFAPAHQTLKLLEAHSFNKILLETPHRFATPALRILATALAQDFSNSSLGENPPLPAETAAGLKVWAAPDRHSEVSSVAQEILYLVHQEGYDFADIGIILRQPRLYLELFREEFSLQNIPWRYWGKEPLRLHPWVRAALELGNLYRLGWERERVFRLLKSGYFEGEFLAADLLEEAAQGLSLDNEAAWRVFLAKEEGSLCPLKVLEILKKLLGYSSEFRGKAKGAVWAERYREVLEEFILPGAVRSWARIHSERPQGPGPLLGVEAFLSIIKEVGDYRGPEETAFADFLSALSLAVDALEIFIPDRRRQAVNLIGIHEARQWELPVVLVVGLVEGEFPAPGKEDIFIKDYQRQALKGRGGPELPLSSSPQEEELLFYLAATRTQERLYLTYPAGGGQKKNFLASNFLQEIETLFTPQTWEEIFTTLPPAGTPPSREKVHSLEALSLFVLGREKEDNPEGEAARWIAANASQYPWPRIKTLPSYQDSLNFSPADFEDKVFSVSELDTFAQCPRLYFYKYILNLEPLALTLDEEQDQTFWGSLAHEILKVFYSHQDKEKPKEGRDDISRLMEKAWEKYAPTIPFSYQVSLEKERLKRTLAHFIERERVRGHLYPFAPFELEWKFGRAETKPLLIETANGFPLRVSGTIDRLDVSLKDKRHAVVVDYKYSKQIKRFKENLKLGRELQIPLYLLAAQELLGYVPVGGLLYYLKISEPGGSFKDMTGIGRESGWPVEFGGKQILLYREKEWQAIFEEVKVNVSNLVGRLRAGDIRATPEFAGYCGQGKCQYFDLCPIRERD